MALIKVENKAMTVGLLTNSLLSGHLNEKCVQFLNSTAYYCFEVSIILTYYKTASTKLHQQQWFKEMASRAFKHSFFRLTLMHALIHCAVCKYGLKGYTFNVTKTILFISLLKFFGSNIGNMVD